MKKTPPPSVPSKIFPPNLDYLYFENRQHYPFQPKADAFALANAWWLAEAALLVYANEADIRKALQTAGLPGAGFEMTFFEKQPTQCMVVHNDNIILLAFRGTEINNFWGAVMDWVTNVQVLPVPYDHQGLVHLGFRQALDDVWDPVKGHLGMLMQPGSPSRTLWITGHSLGGAIALLAADYARQAGLPVHGIYTFGSPRMGDRGFKQAYMQSGLAKKTYRMVNNHDPVPRVPPPILYTHVGAFQYIDNAGHLHEISGEEEVAGLLDAFSLALAQPLLPHFDFLRHVDRNHQLIIPGFLADHAPIYYAIYMWNNLDSVP